MSLNLVAIAYALIGLFAATGLALACFPGNRPTILRIALTWVLITVFILLSPPAGVFMFLACIVLLVLTPRENSDRLLYYCAILLSVPSQFQLRIPFPGINYLYDLNFPVLLNFIVLLPALAQVASDKQAQINRPPAHGKIVVLTMIYLVVISILDFRLTTVTNGLRMSLHNLLFYAIPLIAVARICTSKEVTQKALFGLLLGGIFMFGIGAVQWVTSWYFYEVVTSDLKFWQVSYAQLFGTRGGQIRVPGTMHPILFGIYLGLCLILLFYFVSRIPVRKWAYLLFPLFLGGMVASDSRAAVLVLIVGLASLMFFAPPLRKLRPLVFVAGVLGIVLAAFVFNVWGALEAADPYDTFRYRVDLLTNAADSISLHPFLGTPDYVTNPTPSLELSRQGEGIIDIVNAYLEVILQYGAVGLFFFILPILVATRHAVRSRRAYEIGGDAEAELLARVMLTVLISYIVVIATVSMLGRPLFLHYWLFAIFCSAIASHVPVAVGSASAPKASNSPVPLSAGY